MIASLLLGLLVKSGIIAGAGLLASKFMARSPTDRVDILRATICMLLVLPVIMALLPSLDIAVLPGANPVPLVAVPSETTSTPMWTGQIAAPAGLAISGSLPWPTRAGLWLAAWVTGALFLAGRLVLGLHTLSRWTRSGDTIACPVWRQPLARITNNQRPRLITSPHIQGPLSWGLAPGIILIDPASLSARDTAPAVIAHEMAHLRRRDWVFLILSRLATALFWFNPLVWKLNATLVARSEEVADALALQTVDRQSYARALVRLASQPPQSVATAMAADPHSLKRRIVCIMSDLPHARRRPLMVALTLAALTIVGTPIAALELHDRPHPAVPAVPQAPHSPSPTNLRQAPRPPAAPALQVVSAPVPPAPPAPASYPSRGYDIYISHVSETPEVRRINAEARASANEARREAERERHEAERMRTIDQAQEARFQAQEARVQAQEARFSADQAQVQADLARQQADHARAESRVQMQQSIVEMRRNAGEMRRQSADLRDPAYRAEQIKRNRARGNRVTDAELQALSPRLAIQATEMERHADWMAQEIRRSSL